MDAEPLVDNLRSVKSDREIAEVRGRIEDCPHDFR
jgi:Xaa-Pro aminopeptidase